MTEWYLNKMHEAHKAGRWEDRANYAEMAGVDFIRVIYLEG